MRALLRRARGSEGRATATTAVWVTALGFWALSTSAYADAPARIVDFLANSATQRLELTVEDGAFDPVLSLDRLPDRRFRLVLEGDDARFDPALRERFDAIRAAIIKTFADVERVTLEESLPGPGPQGRPHVRIALETRLARMPQIRVNAGRTISIGVDTAAPQAQNTQSVPGASDQPAPAAASSTSAAPAWHSPLFSLDGYFASNATGGAPDPLKAVWRQRAKGETVAALEAIQAFRRQNPRDPVAALLYAELQLDAGQREDAVAALQTLITQSPAFYAAWETLIRETLSTGGAPSRAQADALLKQALEYWPDQAELVYLDGLRCELGGEMQAAANAFERAQTLAPGHDRAAYRLAVCLLKLNRTPQAIIALTRTLRLNPENLAAQKALAYAYQISGRAQDALALDRQALKPDALINYAGLSLLEAEGASPEVRQSALAKTALLYRAADVLIPVGDDMRRYLAQSCADAGFKQEAIRLYGVYLQEARARLTQKDLSSDEQARLTQAIQDAQDAIAQLAPTLSAPETAKDAEVSPPASPSPASP